MVAGIVGQAQRRLIGKGVLGDEVVPPDVEPVDRRALCRLVDQPLQHIGRLRPPGAAIGIDRQWCW